MTYNEFVEIYTEKFQENIPNEFEFKAYISPYVLNSCETLEAAINYIHTNIDKVRYYAESFMEIDIKHLKERVAFLEDAVKYRDGLIDSLFETIKKI